MAGCLTHNNQMSVSVLLLSLAALCLVAIASPNPIGPHRIHPMAEAKHAQQASAHRLRFHGGDVIQNANIYSVWMGQPAATNTSESLRSFVNSLNNTLYFNTLSQYMEGQQPSATMHHHTFVSPDEIKIGCATSSEEVTNYLCSLRTPDENDIYAWMTTQARPSSCQACGWHSSISCNQTTVQVIFVFNSQYDRGCCINCRIKEPVQPEPFASYLSIFTHELFETMTDPGPHYNGWWDNKGAEIGDKCAWKFGNKGGLEYTTVGTDNFNIQTEWSNNLNTCVKATALPTPKPTKSPHMMQG
jgi:hypothetical protein